MLPGVNQIGELWKIFIAHRTGSYKRNSVRGRGLLI